MRCIWLEVDQYVDIDYMHVLCEYRLIRACFLGSRSKRVFSLGFLL